MGLISIRAGALVLAPLIWTQPALGHGIAGNRFFDGTLSFDDPAVADEAIVPLYSQLTHPTTLGSDVGENRINWAFARLLTPTVAFTADSGWLHQNWPIGHTSGADKTDIGLKYEAYRNNQHERWFRCVSSGASATQERQELEPMHPTRSSPACSSAKGLATCLPRSRGYGRSP
jgi:hypothetical protein